MKFLFRNIIIAFCMALQLSCAAFAASSEIIYDNCFITKVMGVKTGYFCSIQRKKTENGKKYIVTDRHFEQKIKRANNQIQTIQDSIYVEEEGGTPVSFSMKSDSSGEKTFISGKFISPYEVSVDFDTNGVKSSKNIKFKDKILFPYAIDSLYVYPDSKTISYATIEPTIDLRAVKIKTEGQGQENLSADGLNRNYNKYKVSINILPGVTGYEWRDRNGKVVKEFSPLFKIENLLADKKEVLDISGEGSFDLFTGGLIPVQKTITDPDSIDQISYKITISDVSVNNLFLNDERQKISLLKNNVLYLKINGQKPDNQLYPYPIHYALPGVDEYLKSGPFIMPDSDKISIVAKQLASGETDTYVIAKKMENWVYNNITNKNYSLDFANAVQTIETKSGDCTEHAVLLASLLRAVGIPSKVVVGLVYTDTPQSAFGYHMWTKAYIGRKWINLDAALPYKNFVATHIAMTETPLNNLSDRADILINLLQGISNIKIEILSTDKPLVTNLGDGAVAINFKNANDGSLTIKTIDNSFKTGELNDLGVKSVSISGLEEKDFVRSAFYNFIKGDVNKSLSDFNSFYDSIPKDDDFSYMKLGLKLSGLGFFNLASKSFDSVKDKDIWALQIENAKKLYFPKKKYTASDEMAICNAVSKIKFQNSPEEGINLINKSKFQNDDYTHYLLAKAYIAENNLNQAQKELQTAVKINPANPTYRFEQAKLYSQRNSYKSAERELNLVKEIAEKGEIKDKAFWQDFNEQNYWLKFKLERKNPLKSKYFKAKYYETKGEYNIALENLNGILSGSTDKSDIFTAIGNIYLKKEDIDKAEQNFRSAVKVNEKNVSALSGLGQISLIRGNNKAALEKYQKALEVDPNNNDIKLKIAETYSLLGLEDEALVYYRSVLQDSSLNLEANYNLGMMYLRSGDVEEAENSLKKALSVNPMFSSIWLDIAGIEITKGNYEIARNYLKSAVYVSEKNPYYYYYCGLVDKAQQNFNSAEENFNKALELNPGFKEVDQELRKLYKEGNI